MRKLRQNSWLNILSQTAQVRSGRVISELLLLDALSMYICDHMSDAALGKILNWND